MALHKQGPYHHGQLRQALIDAALHLLAVRGIESLTLREVARQAGVSHAAPYHHFADKSALVEALVVESFQALATALHDATRTSFGTAFEQLIILGRVYVRFALEHPAAFRLMYRPELRQPSFLERQEQTASPSPIDQAGLEAYQVLTNGVIACQQAGVIPPRDPAPLTLTAWCTIHGLTVLLLDGSPGNVFRGEQSLEDADHLTSMVTQILIHGLRTWQAEPAQIFPL